MSSNATLFQHAQHYLVGGVNSPVRAFGSVGGTPRFIHSGKGAIISDCTGREYIDYVGAWGPAILGHAHPNLVKILQEQLEHGIGFGAPHELEAELASLLCDAIPSMEQVRFTCSGTEAVMTAVRLARGHTGRDGVIKFVGGYHGHSDTMLVNAGSGALSLGQPSSAGVPKAAAQHTLSAEYNQIESVEQIFKAHAKDIACVIVEPVAGNMGCVLPHKEFLPKLRELCTHYDALLIFDEVMTGFRVCYGGAQKRYGVNPDLTVLGKIIGGGLAIGAVGGSRPLMSKLAPLGDVYQAGTLSGNPLTMNAGITTLKELKAPDFYTRLEERAAELCSGIHEHAKKAGVALAVSQIGGMFGLFFGSESVATNYREVQSCDKQAFVRFFQQMLDQGVYLPPSAYETCFMSIAHDSDIIQRTLDAVRHSLNNLN